MRPDTLIVRHLAARAALLWIGARLIASVMIALGGGDPVHMTLGSTIMIVLGTLALCIVDVHRRHEWALLGNLGVSRTVLALVFAVPAIVGELGFAVVAEGVRG